MSHSFSIQEVVRRAGLTSRAQRSRQGRAVSAGPCEPGMVGFRSGP